MSSERPDADVETDGKRDVIDKYVIRSRISRVMTSRETSLDARCLRHLAARLEACETERDTAMEVARGAEMAAFHWRGELGAAYMCQTCGGAGTVEDGRGDFETCPGCGVDWFKCAKCRAEACESLLRALEDEARQLQASSERASAFIGHKNLGDEFVSWSLRQDAEIDALLKEEA